MRRVMASVDDINHVLLANVYKLELASASLNVVGSLLPKECIGLHMSALYLQNRKDASAESSREATSYHANGKRWTAKCGVDNC